MPVCPVCLNECIEIKDNMAIHRYMDEWVTNMCVISPRTIANQSFIDQYKGNPMKYKGIYPDKILECEADTEQVTYE